MPPKLELPEEQICIEYKNGSLVKELASEYGCSTHPIEQILRKHGVRKQGVLPIQEIIELYNSGLSSLKIAKKIGCDKSTVLEILHKNNVPIVYKRIRPKTTTLTQKDYRQTYRTKHKERLSLEEKNRRATDKNHALKKNLRCRIYLAVRGYNKSASTMELIGCSIQKLKQHLESKFTTGMSWDNYGKWHIDHIRPCCSFDLVSSEQQKECFHYTNLQPLWGRENLSKGGSYER